MREKQLIADLNAAEGRIGARRRARKSSCGRWSARLTRSASCSKSYLTRYREASSRKDGNYLPADARIFSRAVVPSEPYFPKIVPIAGAAFVGSLLVMAIVTLLQELFSGRAMRPAAGSHAR